MAQTDGPLPALAAEQPEHHVFGPLSVVLLDGDLRRVTFHGVEVLRRLSCPIRDASWGTLVVEETEAALTHRADGFTYLRRFVTAALSFDSWAAPTLAAGMRSVPPSVPRTAPPTTATPAPTAAPAAPAAPAAAQPAAPAAAPAPSKAAPAWAKKAA